MTIVNCKVNDCRNNKKDNDTCKLDTILIGDKKECLRYFLDIDYLKKRWWKK